MTFYSQEALSYLNISLISSLLLFAFYPIHTGFAIDRIFRERLKDAGYDGRIGTQYYKIVGLYGVPIVFELVVLYVYLLHVDASSFKPASELKIQDRSNNTKSSSLALTDDSSQVNYPIILEPPSYNIKMKYIPYILGCGLVTILLLGSRNPDSVTVYGGYCFGFVTIFFIVILFRSLYLREGRIEITNTSLFVQCSYKAFSFKWHEIKEIQSGLDVKAAEAGNSGHMGIVLYETDYLGFDRFIKFENSCGYRQDEFIKLLKHHHKLHSK